MTSPLEVVGSLSVAYLLYRLVLLFAQQGISGLLNLLTRTVRCIPGVDGLLTSYIESEVSGFIKELYKEDGVDRSSLSQIPEKGEAYEDVLKQVKELKEAEADVQNKVFAYKYVSDGQIKQLQEISIRLGTDAMGYSANQQSLIETVQAMFMNENALNPIAFPSLRKFEVELVAMTAVMLNAPQGACGSVTSGGTESILMAVKTYRDFARKHKPNITKPELVAPISIHPAFEKAAEYFGLTVVHTPLNDKYEADVTAMEASITANTIMLAVSAPAYPHGILDPVSEAAAVALRRSLPLHIDACYGGFMLPWIEQLGEEMEPWDFRCAGVTSVSADLHKFGYTPKGASVVVYRNEYLRRHQLFSYTQWPGGLFGSTTMAGTRSGSVLAAAWATLRHIGQDGYVSKARLMMETTRTLQRGIGEINGLEVVGSPVMTCFAIASTSDRLNILVLADAMERKSWRMERQQLPDTLHFSILPQHVGQEDQLLADLAAAVEECWDRKAEEGESAALYGMIAKIPDNTIVDDFVTEYFSKVYM